MYALMIWTIVSMSGQGHGLRIERDWRPIAEFHYHQGDSITAVQKKCEDAARQLGLDAKRYLCVKLK